MELRTFNVTKVYFYCVKCAIGNDLGVNKDKIDYHRKDIAEMVSQLPDNEILAKCHVRKDGEQWTPYLQVVRMIVLLGAHIGAITLTEELKETTIVRKNEDFRIDNSQKTDS